MAAVVAGGLVLLALAWTGAGVVFEAAPRLRFVLALLGSAWLAGLGALMLLQSLRPPAAPRPDGALLPRAWTAVVLFQLVNPKAWLLMVTATAALDVHDWPAFASLCGVFVLLSGSALTAWAVAGSALGAALARPGAQRRFDALMGALLVGSAAALVLA